MNDPFTDNDTAGWAVPDLDGDGTTAGDDGAWAASGAALACSGVITVSGSPDAGTGSIILIDGPRYQQVRILATATLNSAADNCGVVFGYVDNQNFWVRLYSKAQQKVFIYQVSSGTWTQRSSGSFTITNGVAFGIEAEARSGAAHGYAATVPAGQVGLWCSHASANAFDNFKVRDLVGPYEADGRWFSDKAEVQIDDSNNNLLRSSSATSSEYYDTCVVRRGFRAGKYVATFRFKWSPGPSPGFLVRWVNPGDWLAVMVKAADSKAWVYKRVNDGILQSPLSSGSTVSLTNGNWYTGKVVVGDDLGNSALQRLRFWIDTDDDGTWSDETALLDTTTVDDDWSSGYAGLFHGHIASTAAQDFDDVKMGFDNNADLDLDDAGDSIVINDDFASNATTLSYDDNGNLTDDGIFKFVYDAWNRLVSVKSRYSGGTTQTTFATYAYDGANRRNSKVVANSGVEVYPNDGGNTTTHYYYNNERQPLEERSGSNLAARQYAWHGRVDMLFIDVNGDGSGNDCDPDGTIGGEAAYQDKRLIVHQDKDHTIIALTEYVPSGASGANGRVVERWPSWGRGLGPTLSGDSGAGEIATLGMHSQSGLSIWSGTRGGRPGGLWWLPPDIVDPLPWSPCRAQWRWGPVVLTLGHIGLQFSAGGDNYCNDAHPCYIDYGHQPACHVGVSNTRWEPPLKEHILATVRDPPGSGFGLTSCQCRCLWDWFIRVPEYNQRYGSCCMYGPLGYPPFTNSNGGINAVRRWCATMCPQDGWMPAPWFGTDPLAPGWSNNYQSFYHDNNCY